MKLRCESELGRCRPLLGTFVEIQVISRASDSPDLLQHAMDQGFKRIEAVQSLMSAHDPGSELSLLNREADRRSVAVSEKLYELLKRGLELSNQSGGAFDFTVAPLLAKWGLLPAELRREGCGDWRSVRLLPGRRVRFQAPLAIDLGGIAKGYAVDQAVEALRASGVRTGWVNAGGDLRAFGDRDFKMGLRHPSNGELGSHSVRVRDEALASSSPCFSQRAWRRQPVSHLVQPGSRRAVVRPISVTVKARECWVADALTKVVLNLPPASAERILEAHGAEAMVFAS